MAIVDVVVNHTERNYFNNYDEIRSDRMVGVSQEKVAKAIEKLCRRYRNSHERHCDCMHVTNEDGTGWRLWYDYDRESFKEGVYRKSLRLRHYTSMETGSWDTDRSVSMEYAKEAIIGEEQ